MATKTQPQARAKPRATERVRARRSRLAGLRQFIADVRAEVKKITWPDRETTRKLTILVIGLSAALGVLLGAIDAIFVRLWDLLQAL
ncbi:preprotein translocase subunit SecE [Thermomicrobiaceae bacterium CFH 74404]|uniref:Protein translocase subunit SecE n=1 Tax=Thermalbibacter longus TaxID=2951981 RepID=A0AA41W9E4_9BACT|nr:preprotein translocase subunit SecE [Thermalbibacter longus]MCM8747522.1 preprotein translocase subunit SecE [Thermalbibacter longus]